MAQRLTSNFNEVYFDVSSKKKSQEADVSFDDKTPEAPKPRPQVQISAEEIKKKAAKKDEDPRITKFKMAEVNVSTITAAS